MRVAMALITLLSVCFSAGVYGVESSQEINMTTKGKQAVKVHISEPRVVAVAPKPVGWGYYQFPGIARWDDGRVCVSYSLAPDAAESYGTSGGSMLSSDGGKTWAPPSGEKGVSGLLLSNGERLAITTPKPYKVADLKLPEPAGIINDNYGNQKMTMYRLNELQPKLRTIRVSRMAKGSDKWVTQHAALDDPQALRYALRGIFPIIWWGDVHVAADDSLVAGIYPGYRMRDDGTMDDKDGVFFYRSTDFGHSWKIQGRIPYQADLKADPKGSVRGGFTEPAFEVLQDGSFICVMRTTDGQGVGPMYASWSKDLGKTWTKPEVITPNGVLPKLLRLENGVLVMASGRPGVQLRFSSDGKGKKWSDPFELVPVSSTTDLGADSCGYTSLVATGPDTFLIAYSHFRHPIETGDLRKAIMVREVKVTPEHLGMTHKDTKEKTMFKRIDHVEILPSDMEKTISFYTDILGFTLKERFPVDAPGLKEVVFLTLGDTMLELLGAEKPTVAPKCTSPVGYARLALEVENMDEAIEYLKSKGVKISWGPMDLGTSKRAEILDPDGLSIELRQW